MFNEVLAKDPHNAAAMYELSNIYSFQGRDNLALDLAKKASSIDPKNEWYQLSYSQILRRASKFAESAEVLGRLSKNFPNRVEFLYEHAEALLLAGKGSEAIKVYQQIEAVTGPTEELIKQKIKIYDQSGENEKALKEAERGVEILPGKARLLGTLGQMYQARGMHDKAFDVFNKLKQVDPENAYVHLSLADHYRLKGDPESAHKELVQAFKNPSLSIEAKTRVLMELFDRSEKDSTVTPKGIELAEIYVQIHPDEPQAHDILGNFYFKTRQIRKARDEFRKTVDLNKESYLIWNKVLLLDSEIGDHDLMMADSKEAMELFPTQPAPYLFNGIANIAKKNYSAAIEALESGAPLVFDNPSLKSQFFASLGDAYHQVKENEKSDENYEKALSLDPDNSYVLNNYSYYLSLRNENLEKAERMSRKSNELEPNNISFLDTYAWILFKLGRYSEALTWMEKAIANGARSGEMFEHLGDILFKLGEKDRALEAWKKAKETGGASALIEKKINDKKLYE